MGDEDAAYTEGARWYQLSEWRKVETGFEGQKASEMVVLVHKSLQ